MDTVQAKLLRTLHILSNLNANELAAVNMGMQAVRFCTSKLSSF